MSEAGQKRTWTPEQREKIMQARRERAQKNGSRTDAELIAEDVVGDAVANVITLSGFLMPIAPYTAVTIAGVPDPENEGSMLVQSRAEMAGRVLLEHAKRNHRVLAAIARFNQLFQSVELVEVVGSVVAAGAVDAHVVEPDATIALPGGAQVPILAPVIGDTIAYIAAQEDQARAQGIDLFATVGMSNEWEIPFGVNFSAIAGLITPGATYDEKHDIARAPMETAQVAEPSDALEVAFAHVGNRCTLRVYIGKTASFADFTAK